ncbi:DNA-binding transcriptional LysR family regulator [Bradyrhizobium sp. AZCC 2262]|uniref:LysR family transcriptional regulator n=1 Tax=Bradyrhizobium sp. AZCC 2262 TaxID=3117022 RepID=UPI002FEFFA37
MNDPFDKLSWDDLRIIKAIAESGALSAAATLLSVNNSTISRRLLRLEQTLGVALFDRRRTGYLPTAAGAELIALAERVELDIVSVARRVSGPVQGHTGDLRVATSDALLLDFLTPIVAEFKTLNPAVRVEVVVGNNLLNLARGESDIAFRASTAAPPDNLFGRKVANVAWAAYGRRSEFAGGRPDPADLYERQWASYGSGLSGLKAFKFVEERVSRERIGYRSDSVAGMAVAIAAGMGIGFLPCMHGDLSHQLMRVSVVEPDISDELWILTHPDIRKSGRVCAFMAHCMEAIGRRRAFIEGRETHGLP